MRDTGIRVGLLFDDRLMRDTLAWLLAAAGMGISFEASSLVELADSSASTFCDVVVIDLDADLGDPTPLGRLRLLKSFSSFPRIIVVNRCPDAALERACRREGMSACLSKTDTGFAEFVETIRRVADGDPATSRALPAEAHAVIPVLTRRERDVLAEIATGADNLKIGAQLGITEHTVKAHVGSLYRKLGTENRVELAVLALRLGMRPREKHGA